MILLVFMAEGFEVDRIEHRADSYPEAVLYRRGLYLQTGVVKGRDDHGDPVELVMLKLTTVFAPGLGELAEVYDKCDMADAMNSSHQLGKLAVLEALQTEPLACGNPLRCAAPGCTESPEANLRFCRAHEGGFEIEFPNR